MYAVSHVSPVNVHCNSHTPLPPHSPDPFRRPFPSPIHLPFSTLRIIKGRITTARAPDRSELIRIPLEKLHRKSLGQAEDEM